MNLVKIIQAITGIAGLIALVLGLLYWFAAANVIQVHMVLGLVVTLGLLSLGVIALLTRGMRPLGAVAVVYALIVPAFGMTQATMLPGDLHWLIRLAHMLVGIGALALMGAISARYRQRSSPAATA
jgi:hypothetical protein